MNSGEPQPEPDRSQIGDSGDFSSRSMGELSHWVQNWSVVLGILLPTLVGSVMVIVAFMFDLFRQSLILETGIGLQLSSYFVVAIWAGLGRKTFVRTVADWVVLMLTMYSIYLIEFSFEPRSFQVIDATTTGLGFLGFCAVNIGLILPFLLFRGEYRFCLPRHLSVEQLTILDLLTVTGIAAICFGFLRSNDMLVSGGSNFGDGDTVFSASQMVTLALDGLEAMFIVVVGGMMAALMVGMPLVVWARYCRRCAGFDNLVLWSLSQIALATCCLVSLVGFFDLSGSYWLAVPVLAFLVFQAFVFLQLVALTIIRFPQGDLIVWKRGKHEW